MVGNRILKRLDKPAVSSPLYLKIFRFRSRRRLRSGAFSGALFLYCSHNFSLDHQPGRRYRPRPGYGRASDTFVSDPQALSKTPITRYSFRTKEPPYLSIEHCIRFFVLIRCL
jgi:hypothetical protein